MPVLCGAAGAAISGGGVVACALPVPALISLVAALATAAPRSPSFTSDNLANTVTRGAAISGGGVLACAALLCLL